MSTDISTLQQIIELWNKVIQLPIFYKNVSWNTIFNT